MSPLVGVWSDRTWAGWLGRRRPSHPGRRSALGAAARADADDQPLAAAGRARRAAAGGGRAGPADRGDLPVHRSPSTAWTTSTRRCWSTSPPSISGTPCRRVGGRRRWPARSASWCWASRSGATACPTRRSPSRRRAAWRLGVSSPVSWACASRRPAVWAADRRREAAVEGPRPLRARHAAALQGRGGVFCLVPFAYWSGVNAVLAARLRLHARHPGRERRRGAAAAGPACCSAPRCSRCRWPGSATATASGG